MNGGTPIGFLLGCVWLAASLLTALGDGSPKLQTDSAPVLKPAVVRGINAVLTVFHPTASSFHVEVTFRDEGISCDSVGFIANPEWKRMADGIYSCKIKIYGDTNSVRVAVAGTTNWSNAVPVIP